MAPPAIIMAPVAFITETATAMLALITVYAVYTAGRHLSTAAAAASDQNLSFSVVLLALLRKPLQSS